MKILFLDTSSFFVTVSIVEEDKILFLYQDSIVDDMSSKIMPIISNAFSSLTFSIRDIDKIMVVNGPGSFTGVRIGVTIAKVLAWSLNKEIVTISSLEYLASSSCNTEYIIPMIDARRGYVYGAVYDKELNPVVSDSYQEYNSFEKYFNNGTIVSFDNLKNSNKPSLDVLKVIKKHLNSKSLNAHEVNPNYLKKTEAEENLGRKNND